MSNHIVDAMVALDIMRELGYSRDTIDLYLQNRWNDKSLINEDEMREYLRVCACKFLKGYRAFRVSNPVLAASQMRRYLSCKDDLAGDLK